MSIDGTYAWMSPEMIKSQPVSSSTDAWSYGVCLWEMLTRERPFAGFSDFQIQFVVAEEGRRLAIPTACPADLSALLVECWQQDPSRRPPFKEIIRRLEAMQANDELTANTANFLRNRDQWLAEIRIEVEQLR